MVDFTWHSEKNEAVRRSRGFGFEDATGIFAGPVVTYQDNRSDYGETRMVAIGQIAGVFFTVVYTDRDRTRHIITAWPSNRKERLRWYASP